MYQFPAAPTSLKVRKTTNIFLLIFGCMWMAAWVASFLILVVIPLEAELRIAIVAVLLLDILVMPCVLWMLSKQKPLLYVMDGKKLTVKRQKPYHDLVMDLSQVTKMEARKNYVYTRSPRARNGNMGVYAVTGLVWNPDLGGWLRLALTSEEDYILLSGDKFGYAVSPQDMDGFMRAAQQELGITV
jgi:hypothetical protein